MFGKLFGKKKVEPAFAYAKINAPLRPRARIELYEEPLGAWLEETKLGAVTGGGAMMNEVGEIQYCGIDIDLYDLERGPASVCELLNRKRAPKGSVLEYEVDGKDVVAPFGIAEGVAVYLNGTDLGEEVYKTTDVGFVIDTIQSLVEPAEGGNGCVVETWDGPRESAI